MPTLNLQVGATGNDGYSDTTGLFDSTTFWVGNNGGDQEEAFARFTGVTIPQAATISSAILTLRAVSNIGTVSNVDLQVFCAAADNPAAPTTQAQHAALTRTSAFANWNPTVWTAGTDYTVDITSVVQEMVNRGDWDSGDALIVLVDDNGTAANNELEARDYSGGAANAPKLDITYTVSALAYEQEGFRWRNDDGSETTATWRQTQDTNDSVAKETPLRLRMLVNATNDPPAAHYKLQYKPPGADTWEDV